MSSLWGCYRCPAQYKDHRECQRHFRKKHNSEYISPDGFDYSKCRRVNPDASVAVDDLSDITFNKPPEMEESSGRGHREKIPSAKVKEQVHKSLDKVDFSASKFVLPTYIAAKDPRFEQEQKEIPKSYDHTKIGPNGEKTDFYTLGNQ